MTSKYVLELVFLKSLKSIYIWGEAKVFNARVNFFRVLGNAFFVSLSLFGAVSSSQAEIYSLGDSLSDTGALGFTYTNPTSLEPLTDGNIWLQYVAKSTPAFCNDSKHCKFDRETFYYSSSGNNYAVGGAGVTFDSTDASLARNYTSLHFQVEALKHNHKFKKRDVVTVWIGANDILAAALDPTTSVANVTRAAKVFKEEVSELAKSGVKIIVITIPALGDTPLGLNTEDGGVFLNQLTDYFNKRIDKLSEYKNVNLININDYFNEITFSRVFDTSAIYCGEIIDPTHQCGDSTTNPIIGDTSNFPFVFADPIHPSNAVHEWLGKKVKSLILKN